MIGALGRQDYGGEGTANPTDVGGGGAGAQSGDHEGTLGGSTGSAGSGPGGGIQNTLRFEYPPPAGGCVEAKVLLNAMQQRNLLAQGDLLDADWRAVLPVTQQRTIDNALARWSSEHPHQPPATVYVTPTAVYALRPHTPYDPVLDKYPVYPPGSPQSDAFNAGLRLFFPDFSLDPLTGASLTGGRTGSMTIYGPFPVTEKFVTPNMVALAVRVAQMPGAFQVGAVGGGPDSPDFLGSLEVGLKATAASKNIYVGAGAAAARFIVSAFDWIFGGDPQPPAWLTALEAEKQLREGGGSPSFAGAISGAGAFMERGRCPRVTINPRGTMTVEQGYQAFIDEITGGAGRVPWLLLGALGLGAYLLTGSRE